MRIYTLDRHNRIGFKISVSKDNLDIFADYMGKHQALEYRTIAVTYRDGYRTPTDYSYVIKGLFEPEDILAFKLSVPCTDYE